MLNEHLLFYTPCEFTVSAEAGRFSRLATELTAFLLGIVGVTEGVAVTGLGCSVFALAARAAL